MVYDIENTRSVFNANHLCFRKRDDISLDTLLMEIRRKAISYASYKNRVQMETEKKYKKKLSLSIKN